MIIANRDFDVGPGVPPELRPARGVVGLAGRRLLAEARRRAAVAEPVSHPGWLGRLPVRVHGTSSREGGNEIERRHAGW